MERYHRLTWRPDQRLGGSYNLRYLDVTSMTIAEMDDFLARAQKARAEEYSIIDTANRSRR